MNEIDGASKEEVLEYASTMAADLALLVEAVGEMRLAASLWECHSLSKRAATGMVGHLRVFDGGLPSSIGHGFA